MPSRSQSLRILSMKRFAQVLSLCHSGTQLQHSHLGSQLDAVVLGHRPRPRPSREGEAQGPSAPPGHECSARVRSPHRGRLRSSVGGTA